MLREPQGLTPEQQHARREFVLRFQQLTGPVTAKGLEDTCFYRYFPVLALAEVGGEPDRLGISVDELHVIQRVRAETRPRGLSASATHDTKRGEDMRARLLVLSEIPNEWSQVVLRWREMNAPHRTRHGGKEYPDTLSEVFIYQSLLGGCPAAGPHSDPTFIPRLKAAVRKAFSEAKLHTSWINPNELFESAVEHFIDGILGDLEGPFLVDLERFAGRLKTPAILNSLVQTLVKIAGPGIPEIYQGTELWDHSFVDPDNRRPVNFDALASQLLTVSTVDDSKACDFLTQAMANPNDGAVKLFVLHRCLQLRHRRRASFESHRYEGCRISGPLARHAFGFARGHAGERVIGVAARLLAGLAAQGLIPVANTWADCFIEVPELSLNLRYRDVLTGHMFVPQTKDGCVGFALDDVFGKLPLALIEEYM